MAGEALTTGFSAVMLCVVMELTVFPASGQQLPPQPLQQRPDPYNNNGGAARLRNEAPPPSSPSSGEFYKAHVLDTCCMIGMQWSNATGRCSGYPAPAPGVAADSQSACLSVVEVCCLKQVQLDMCESGKRTALEGHMCAVRDSDSGAEQFRECCKCCQMGVEARRQSASCEIPGLGEPCDSKFAECCTGRPSANLTFPEAMDCFADNPCEQRCVQRHAGPECQCHQGYRLNNDGRTCTDIDECAAGSYRCSPSQRCFNTKGGYACLTADCHPGSVRNPRTGQCEVQNACLSGYAFNSISRRCEDINECALGLDDCKVGERCENKRGSFSCRRLRHCGTGYTLDEESQSCVDNDECVLGTHNCAGGFDCQNVQGSFRCVPKQCPVGFRFDSGSGDCQRIFCRRGMRPNRGGSCVDIDECSEGNHRCLRHQQCVNRVGSYTCRSLVSCPPGYEPTSNSGCQDINECASGQHRCTSDQECVNRQGSYFCQCPRGMRHDPSGRCEDIDECLTDNMCQHTCRNVQGSYFCTCNRGYQLRDDKRSCEDIDECTQFRGLGGRGGVCGGRCINTPGSYRCECPEGWRLKRNGRSCQDIDECQENLAFCPQQDGVCVNTRGSYKCPLVRCPEGFAKTSSSGPQHRAFITEEDGVVCGRMECDVADRSCLQNKTKTIAWQFLAIPDIEFVRAPTSLLNIRTVAYSIYPNLHLRISVGNERGLFDTVVKGDSGALRLLKPVRGPAELDLTLILENRDFSQQLVISRHVTYVKIYVSQYSII